MSGTVKYQRNSINNAAITCTTLNFDKIAKIELEYGRFFSAEEDNSGTAVAIIGGALKDELFKDRNPIGESIKVNGYSATVIGVTKKAGESMVNSPFSMSFVKTPEKLTVVINT